MNSPIFILTGTAGAGKTTIAQNLLQRFEHGLHIPLDDLREWVVSGIAHPIPEWTEETSRQFDLAYQAAAQIAKLYAAAKFAVVIEQIIYPHYVNNILEPILAPIKPHKIFLCPQVSVARIRNAERTNKDFDTSVLDEAIQAIHHSLYSEITNDNRWMQIDNSFLTIDETVDIIMQSTLS